MKYPLLKGDFENCMEFQTTFNSNTSLTDIHEFQLLRTFVDGYEKCILDKVDMSENQFTNVLQALPM